MDGLFALSILLRAFWLEKEVTDHEEDQWEQIAGKGAP